jgi:hypothetical protein
METQVFKRGGHQRSLNRFCFRAFDPLLAYLTLLLWVYWLRNYKFYENKSLNIEYKNIIKKTI